MSLGLRVRQCPRSGSPKRREKLVAQRLLIFIVFRSHDRENRIVRQPF